MKAFLRRYKFCREMGIKKPFRAALDKRFISGGAIEVFM